MYPFVTHTWNPISGKCLHDCLYCYMKAWPQKELHLNEKGLLKDNHGKGNFIFVGSSTDMFAENVTQEWINLVLQKCRTYEHNHYLFQTKNPVRLEQKFSNKSMLAVTIETNRDYGFEISHAPIISERFYHLIHRSYDYPVMVSIEPIMDFDTQYFVEGLKDIRPVKISIGADSQGHNLPEPEPEKLKELISACKEITEDIVLKDNLKRLLRMNESLY